MQSKRIFSLVLAVVLACTAASPAFAATSRTVNFPIRWNQQQLGEENTVASIRITAAKNAVYGSPIDLTITAEPAETQYIAVVIGTGGEAKGFVTLLLPEKVRILLELIPLPASMAANVEKAGNFNLYQYLKQLIDGSDADVLLRVAEELTAVMDVLKYYMPSLSDFVTSMRQALNLIRRFLPASMATRIYLDEQPTDSGNYLAGAVTLGDDQLNTAGLATISVARKSAGVRMYWTDQTPAAMTVEEAKAFDFSAVTEDNGTIVQNSKVSYVYKNKQGTARYQSDVPPTEPGEYTQTAELGGNYKAEKISRSFKIVA